MLNMLPRIIGLLCVCALAACMHTPETGMPTLKQTFKGDFHIGTAMGRGTFKDEHGYALRLVADQFDTVTSANMLKWTPFNPKPGVYRYELADTLVDFGNRHDMYVVGHVLFWHAQTPNWVYENADGETLDRDALLTRMRERVRHVAKRYGSRIDAWDVVNESIVDNGSLRKSQWTQIVGPDFIEQAFRIADEELPKSVELIYNDYSMTAKGRRDAVVAMVKDFKRKGVRIDGVGMQAHWSVDGPSVDRIEESILAFSEAGVDVHITELDIDVLPRKPGMFGADIAKRYEQDESMNPYTEGLPDAMQQKLARRYGDLFQLFLKHQDRVKRVTFWGATDKYSWLNSWPIKGRTSYPMLFDRAGQPKPAFYAVIGLKDDTIDITR